MELDAPIYKVKIDYDDAETGMMRNSFVEQPAVEVNRIAFNKSQELKFASQESEQKFMSVSMLANTPIPRVTQTGEKYYLIFESDDIKMIVNKMCMEGLTNEINFQHDSTKVIEGVYLVEHFFVEKGRVECPVFKDAPDGSWITTYWVKDKIQYEQLLNSKEFNGFSIEISARFEEEFSKQLTESNPQLDSVLKDIDLLFDSINNPKERNKAILKYFKSKGWV